MLAEAIVVEVLKLLLPNSKLFSPDNISIADTGPAINMTQRISAEVNDGQAFGWSCHDGKLVRWKNAVLLFIFK